jgi:hypothetical protein
VYIQQLAKADGPAPTHTDEHQPVSNPSKLQTEPNPAIVYQVRVKGHLGGEWRDWFGGLTITLADNGETLVTGPLVDQAALHGLLKKVRDLGLPLISVIPVTPGEPDAPRDQS